MRRTGYPSTDTNATERIRGFAVILHESDYLDLIARHGALNQGDYRTYLADLYCRISAARQADNQVLIGPFLTDQYESYAEAIGQPASSAQALRAYDDFVARAGPHTRTWTGEPMSHVVADLREATDTRAEQARLLPLLKQAANLHPNPQHAASEALETAADLLAPLLKRTEPGHHTLTCTVQLPRAQIKYALPVIRARDIIAFPDGAPEQLLCVALATAQLADCPATLMLHSRRLTVPAEASQEPNQPSPPIGSRHPDPLTLRAWRLAAGRAIPLTAGQTFDLACTDSARSQRTPPEPSAQYAAAFPIAGQPP